uniref:Small ribosomal subunit protein uS9c n=1 Tax=Vischeria sp. CAUP Q 202 TaxID=1805947 RepID=A0A1D8RDR1_9STRA|nr:ribosomal protein S9 [Vischeria punctata]AOW70837.1 ribosomal protein S9 [Vischeria sp. CAUP Q 202]UTV00832.1 ribosomal protein S9 [Vischeria punctata]
MTILEAKNILSTGVGRRKSATAFVQIIPGNGEITINQQPGVNYFHYNSQAVSICRTALEIFESEKSYNLTVVVSGGGLNGQIQAIRLALSKAVSKLDTTKRIKLRSLGLLSRDTRVKERKKYGLKKARKAPQFSKR